jgi:chemotaxis protein MotA
MKAATAIGIGAGTFALLFASMMEGTQPMAFFNIPALIIVLVGTGAATLSSVGMETMKKIPSLYKLAFGPPELDMRGRVELIVSLAEQARREGLLALDAQLSEIDDEFTRKGLQLVVDGTDPELVKDILESDLDAMEARHSQQASLFQNAGGFAPTLGIIGTVMGLVHVLENLSDPNSLGPAISTAFIATFYGVASANLYYLPIGNKLKKITHEEVHSRTMIIEGIVSIQAGDNPRVVEEKLKTFLDPAERAAYDGAKDEGGRDMAAAA